MRRLDGGGADVRVCVLIWEGGGGDVQLEQQEQQEQQQQQQQQQQPRSGGMAHGLQEESIGQ